MGANLSSNNSSIQNDILNKSDFSNRKSKTFASTIKKKFSKKDKGLAKKNYYSKILRDFLITWSTDNLIQLINDYEKSSIVKEYYLQSELAHSSYTNISSDLKNLYDLNICADTYLLFKDEIFPVHKSIVCARCPLLRELLGKIYTFGSTVSIDLKNPKITKDLFKSLLRFLYTGEPIDYQKNFFMTNFEYDSLMKELSCYVPNNLNIDLKHLFDTGVYSDVKIVFNNTNSNNSFKVSNKPNDLCEACLSQSEYSCHAAVLASRSRFFKNLITKYQKQILEDDNQLTNNANQKIRIVLDEKVIPKKYAKIILYTVYQDSTDILHLLPSCVCKCFFKNNVSEQKFNQENTLSNLISKPQQIPNESKNYINEIIDLLVIGRFLELNFLISICEKLLVSSITIDNVIKILKWSEQSNNANFVKRQALYFIKEEFNCIPAKYLNQLEDHQFIELLKSDFLQASEHEVLCSIINWSEHNLDLKEKLNDSSQYISCADRRLKLKELINPLIKYLRIGHILPLENDILKNALKNNLISTIPPYMLNTDQTLSYERGIMAWINLEARPNFVKPRFFLSFYEEAKSYLDERMARCEEINLNNFIEKKSLNKFYEMSDNLYTTNTNTKMNEKNKKLLIDPNLSLNADILMIKKIKEKFTPYNKVYFDSSFLEKSIVKSIKQNSEEIYLNILPNIRALNLEEKYEVMIYIQLKVLRENNLPDDLLEIFEENQGDLDDVYYENLNNLINKCKIVDENTDKFIIQENLLIKNEEKSYESPTSIKSTMKLNNLSENSINSFTDDNYDNLKDDLNNSYNKKNLSNNDNMINNHDNMNSSNNLINNNGNKLDNIMMNNHMMNNNSNLINNFINNHDKVINNHVNNHDDIINNHVGILSNHETLISNDAFVNLDEMFF